MKSVVVAALSVALVAVASAVSAADIARRPQMPAKAPAYAEPAFTWTGSYIGISGGGAWGRSDWSGVGAFDVSGGLVGGTLGYNYQFGNVVWGLEGDISWADISGSMTNAACPPGCAAHNNWLATARGRLGYAWDRWLPYLTGGAAIGDIKASSPGFGGASDTRVGWTAGGGLEYAFSPNLSAKVEYLYVDLGHFDCGITCGGPLPNTASFQTHIVRGGLNFRF
jgi:outer membrane immunogenic protein